MHGAGPGLRSLSVLLKVKGVSERERVRERGADSLQTAPRRPLRQEIGTWAKRGFCFFLFVFFFREDDKEDRGHW